MWARWTTRRGDACTLFPFGDHVGLYRSLSCTKLHLLLHVRCPALEPVCVQMRQIGQICDKRSTSCRAAARCFLCISLMWPYACPWCGPRGGLGLCQCLMCKYLEAFLMDLHLGWPRKVCAHFGLQQCFKGIHPVLPPPPTLTMHVPTCLWNTLHQVAWLYMQGPSSYEHGSGS